MTLLNREREGENGLNGLEYIVNEVDTKEFNAYCI